MKKFIYLSLSILSVACISCQQVEEPEPSKTERNVIVSFVSEPNQSLTKAFFDPIATTEAWEKSLSSLTVLVFDEMGTTIVQRQFTAEELTAKKATFALPRSSAGKSCDFYAIANKEITGIAKKTELVALLDNAAGDYNGTFAQVSTQAKRTDGFIMSGYLTKSVAQGSEVTQVAIPLKRTVSKVAIQASLSPDFGTKYEGAVKINSAVLSKAASQTPIIPSSTPSPGTMSYTHTQTTGEVTGKFNNLFYLYENGTLTVGNRVLVDLEGIYDRDGNFSTTTDQTPVNYSFELNGATDNGQIMRNGYYRVAVTLTGLTGQDVSATITVADWETPITQSISIGK